MKLHPVLAALGICVLSCSLARAELVTFTLTLDAPSAAANRLTLSLLGGSATSDLAGDMSAQVEINRATGVISTWELLFSTTPSITSSNWSLTAGTLPGTAIVVGAVSATNVTASMDTTAASSTVTAGTVPSSEQQLRLIGGTVVAPAIGFTDTFTPANSTDIPGLPAPATAVLTSTLNAGLGVYDIVFNLPIGNNQNLGAPGADLNILGNVVARGTVAVPEPTSAVMLLVSGCAVAFRRRRSV